MVRRINMEASSTHSIHRTLSTSSRAGTTALRRSNLTVNNLTASHHLLANTAVVISSTLRRRRVHTRAADTARLSSSTGSSNLTLRHRNNSTGIRPTRRIRHRVVRTVRRLLVGIKVTMGRVRRMGRGTRIRDGNEVA